MDINSQVAGEMTPKPVGIVQRLLCCWPDALAVLCFLLISFFYFQTPIAEGLVLGGHDNDAAVSIGRDCIELREQTGETSRWTNGIFSGMPTYQISPSYDSTEWLGVFKSIYALGTSGVLNYVFLYLLGFYILMRAFNFKVWLAALGAVVWAFSSYFFIIITAGHIWKVLTLAFIPPTIAGMVLCYRGKLLWGGAVMALFTALQILSNHVQMSYYFLFVMFCMAAALGVAAFFNSSSKKQDDIEAPWTFSSLTPAKWLKATAVIAVAGILGVTANLSNIYHTYAYSKESMRGKAELTPLPTPGGETKANPTNGLDYDYITGWSYGIGETLTLMIPDFKGGGSGESMLDTDAAESHDTYLYQVQNLAAILQSNPPGISRYWGEQPGTVGPVYVGAIVCFLFVFGLFFVRGPMKWAMLAATLISFIFAWGSNIPSVTHFLIDHFPMYNKFRTVSSALVIAEFTMPLLAMICLAKIIRQPEALQQRKPTIAFFVALALTAGVCFLFWVAPGMAGNCINSGEREFFTYLSGFQAQLPLDINGYQQAVTDIRHAILSASAGRSLLFILLAAGMIVAYVRVKAFKGWMLCAVLLLLSLFDMWNENKRYLNDDCFKEPSYRQQLVQPTAADKAILTDTTAHYRVYDVAGFTTNRSSYFHETIGGYHAAKLRRYQDLIERHIMSEARLFVGAVTDAQKALLEDTAKVQALGIRNEQQLVDVLAPKVTADSLLHLPVLDMLNTKYFIFGNGSVAVRNYGANGNAWMVQDLQFVKGADAEMVALKMMNTKTQAVADEQFRAQLDGTSLGKGEVRLTDYQLNRMRFLVDAEKDGVVVFSDIYYPGWTATVDGTPVEIGRVNYLLRALKVPAGHHEIVMEFHPSSLTMTDTMAYIALVLIVLAFAAAVFFTVKRR